MPAFADTPGSVEQRVHRLYQLINGSCLTPPLPISANVAYGQALTTPGTIRAGLSAQQGLPGRPHIAGIADILGEGASIMILRVAGVVTIYLGHAPRSTHSPTPGAATLPPRIPARGRSSS